MWKEFVQMIQCNATWTRCKEFVQMIKCNATWTRCKVCANDNLDQVQGEEVMITPRGRLGATAEDPSSGGFFFQRNLPFILIN